MTVKELREKRAKIAARMRELADLSNDENHEWSEEDERNWKAANEDYNTLTRQIEVLERTEEVEREQAARLDDERRTPGREDTDGREDRQAGGVTEEHRALAMQAWVLEQCGRELDERHREACSLVGIDPRRRDYMARMLATAQLRSMQEVYQETHPSGVRAALKRALSAIDGPAGAHTIPEGFVMAFERAQLHFGGMLQVAEIIRTDTGNDLPWPSADDTSNSGEQIGESTAVSEQDVTIKKHTWRAYKFTSKMIKVPVELLEDSAFDLVALIGSLLGERLGRILNTKFTTGSGAGTPYGIVEASALGVTAASATAIAADELFDLKHSVDPAYRVGARWMLHDNILLALRKLKDGEGRYLWQSGLADGAPDRLDGDPISINQDMASSVATTNKTILYGQLSKYKVRLVRAMRVRRLIERYADADQEAFVAFERADGGLLDAGTNPVKHLVQA